MAVKSESCVHLFRISLSCKGSALRVVVRSRADNGGHILAMPFSGKLGISWREKIVR